MLSIYLLLPFCDDAGSSELEDSLVLWVEDWWENRRYLLKIPLPGGEYFHQNYRRKAA